MSALLIVNADDLGQSEGITRGILEAQARGIVTSASVMVCWPDAAEGCRRALDTDLGLGLHLDFGEWAFRDGDWLALYEVVDLNDETAVRGEIHRQLDRFIELVGRAPDHVDSHQHVHHRETVRSAVDEIAATIGACVRGIDPRVRHCGRFYGQTSEGDPLPDAISVAALVEILDGVRDGVTELACHPGFEVTVDTMYRAERAVEVATLCDARVREAIEATDIQLCTYGDL